MKSTRRSGALRRDDIPPAVLRRLNAGEIETASLAEGLAIDFPSLLRHAAPELSSASLRRVRPEDGVVRRMRCSGQILAEELGPAELPRFVAHPSDTVRGWAAFLVAAVADLPLSARLSLWRPLADDSHFGVREWAWLAARGAIADDVRLAVRLLTPWTRDPSANIRRFASESTRPRGVWSAHLAELKERPEIGRKLLEPLRADPSRYVQNSVANWLNDAAKSRPEWVRALCARWLLRRPSAATIYIARRGQRSL